MPNAGSMSCERWWKQEQWTPLAPRIARHLRHSGAQAHVKPNPEWANLSIFSSLHHHCHANKQRLKIVFKRILDFCIAVEIDHLAQVTRPICASALAGSGPSRELRFPDKYRDANSPWPRASPRHGLRKRQQGTGVQSTKASSPMSSLSRARSVAAGVLNSEMLFFQGDSIFW